MFYIPKSKGSAQLDRIEKSLNELVEQSLTPDEVRQIVIDAIESRLPAKPPPAVPETATVLSTHPPIYVTEPKGKFAQWKDLVLGVADKDNTPSTVNEPDLKGKIKLLKDQARREPHASKRGELVRQVSLLLGEDWEDAYKGVNPDLIATTRKVILELKAFKGRQLGVQALQREVRKQFPVPSIVISIALGELIADGEVIESSAGCYRYYRLRPVDQRSG